LRSDEIFNFVSAWRFLTQFIVLKSVSLTGATLGVRDVVSQNLDSVVAGIRGEIDMELRGDAKSLALDLLDWAVKDWERVVKAVDNTYQEACINATGNCGVASPPQGRWGGLLGVDPRASQGVLLVSLSRPRQAVQMASKVADPIRRSTHYVWATLNYYDLLLSAGA